MPKRNAKRSARFIPRGSFEHRDECVLREFFGPSRIGCAPPEESPDGGTVSVEQQLERCFGTVPNLAHQLVIAGHVDARHKGNVPSGQKVAALAYAASARQAELGPRTSDLGPRTSV